MSEPADQKPKLSELLDAVITAHGGLDRRKAVRSVDVTFNFSGGLLDLKGFPGHHRPTASVDVRQPRVVLQRLGGDPDDRWIFTRDRVWIERRDGWSVVERSNPRAAFAGHVRETPLGQAAFDVFSGLRVVELPDSTIPVRVARFQFQELDPHVDSRDTWRVLEVTYPNNIPAHTKTQRLYFDDTFMLKRWDYETDVLGGVAAHYCTDPVTIGGIVFSHIASRGSSHTRRPTFVGPHVVRSRLHELKSGHEKWRAGGVPRSTRRRPDYEQLFGKNRSSYRRFAWNRPR